MEAFGISVEATSLLPLNIWRLWTYVRRRGNLFDLGLEMGCLVPSRKPQSGNQMLTWRSDASRSWLS